MEELNRQVRRARRWLGLQRFSESLGVCCFVTLLIALALVVADKYRSLGIEAWVYPVAGLLVGTATAAAIAWYRGRGSIDAAIEIDRRFGLKERVSSTLALSPAERESEIGQALVADAERRVKNLDVGERFRLAPGWQLLLPLVPLATAVLVVWLVPAATRQDPQINPASVQKQVKNASGSLKHKLIEQRKAAQKAGLKDAEMLFQRLSEETEDLNRDNADSRKDALVKLNDLKRQMESRQQQIEGAEEIRKKLDQLNSGSRGPAENFMKALSEGDLRKGIEELEKLKSDLADGKLSQEEKKQLAQQLDEMKKKLEDAVQKHEQQRQNLQNQLSQAQQAGDQAEADRLQQQLNQLMENSADMQQLQDMARKLGQCSQAMRDGQLQDAAGMLEQMQSDLSDLQQQIDEMEMLDEAMDQLSQSRDQMNCPHCGGQGCQACMGSEPGMGLGSGQGKGDRPEAETGTKFYDDKANQKIGKGAATIAGEVEGPNVKGAVLQQIEEQLEAARSEAVDPLTEQQMPRQHQEQTKEYFDLYRKGEVPR
ncbi:MAG: hypothetical protein ACYC6Y_08010 [Thermoguttaceae bacterium]